MASVGRVVRLTRVLLATLVLVLAVSALADIGVGDRREDVLQLLGPPSARAKRGDREIFMYPHGGRIEFIDGKVVDVSGPLPAPAVPQTPANGPGATAPILPPTATPGAPPQKSLAPASAPHPSSSAQPAGGNLEQLTEQMENAPNPAATAESLVSQFTHLDPGSARAVPSTSGTARSSVPKLLVGLVLHFGITLLALFIAFKIEEMDALWSGTLAIAGIDLAVYAALQALGPVTSGLSSMIAIQSGICALVMVFTIRQFCINRRLQNAVITAMAVKFVVQLCDMFLFTLAIQTLFG